VTSAVVRHVIDSISPASSAFAEASRAAVAAAGAPILEQLAARLGGAQHVPRPRTERRTILVCAGDHGAGDPGIALGASHPTVIAATAIADGTAALVDVARAGHARIVVVDAGTVEPQAMPASTIALGRGPTRNLLHEPAMTVVDATLGLEAGIALAMSLAEAGLDVLALGAIGLGSELSAAALLGAVQPDVRVTDIAGGDPGIEAAVAAGHRLAGASGLELLVAFGGPETAVLAGLILGAASIHTPIVLDGQATGAAATIAAALARAVTGYLIAAHAGTGAQPGLVARLGLAPVFNVGLGHGEGIGAAMVLPLIDQVMELAAREASR